MPISTINPMNTLLSFSLVSQVVSSFFKQSLAYLFVSLTITLMNSSEKKVSKISIEVAIAMLNQLVL